jgi:HEAT repeat protein
VTKRGIIAIVAATVVLIAAVSWYSLRPATTYHGKTVLTLSRQLFNGSSAAKTEATEAFHSLGSNAVPVLLAQLHARDSILRRVAWASLPHVSYGIAKWIRANVNAPDAMARRVEAAHALGEIGASAAVAIPELTRALLEGPNPIRIEAATALARMGPLGMPGLKSALQSADPMLRRAAVTGIAAKPSADAEMARILLDTLDDPQDYVRYAASAGIGARGPELLPELVALARSTDSHRRFRVAQAFLIFRANRQVAVPALVALCGDDDDTCRLQAVKTLGSFQLPNRQIVDALCGALKDRMPEIRVTAAYALSFARFQIRAVLPEILVALKDPSPIVRETSAAGLARFRSSAIVALPRLFEAGSDEDARVRVAASNSIVAIEMAVEDSK